jgi:hypothetical protein
LGVGINADFWAGYYWVVSQILSKKLHSADAESMSYTTDIMDKLEHVKNSIVADPVVEF